MADFVNEDHIRKILRVARLDRGLTLDEVAAKMAEITGDEPLSRATIHNYESNKRHPRVDRMSAWAAALGLRLIVDVLGEKDERIAALVTPATARIAYAIDLLSEEDREFVRAVVERLIA